MARATRVASWREEFLEWLTPFLVAFGREAQRHWAPRYLEGLLGPGDRKSVEPMAARVCPGETQQLHHFVAAAPWATAPLEAVLAQAADQFGRGVGQVVYLQLSRCRAQRARVEGIHRSCSIRQLPNGTAIAHSSKVAQSRIWVFFYNRREPPRS